MNKIAAFLVTLIILTTLIVTMMKPALHKQVMITDADFSFVEESVESVDRLPKVVNTQKTKPESVTVQKDVSPQPSVQKIQPKSQTAASNPVIPKIEKEAKPAAPSKPQTRKINQISKPITNSSVQKPASQKIIQQESAKTVKKEEPKIQTNAPTVVRQLTEQEEIIAWNKWRSDLQNQVMRDTKISAPLGTTFKFSFTVDKFGNLSNIKVWSTNPVYSETAVRVIKPVLASYQGKPILTFPQGTKRVITNVTGGFTMATSTGYSKPSDYSDYERVKK